MKLDSRMHNSKGNPHSQYENIVLETKHPTLYNFGWNLIADNKYKYSATGDTPMKTSMSFILYSNELQSTNATELVTISITLQNSLECEIGIKNLIGNRQDCVRAVQTTENGFERLRIYVQNNGYGRQRIVPLTFDTIQWLSTIEYEWANKRLSSKDRVTSYFNATGKTQDIETLPAGKVFINGYLLSSTTADITRGELDVNGVSLCHVKTSNSAYLNNFEGGFEGQHLVLSYSNSPTQLTITQTGNIRLKNGSQLQPQNDTNLIFIKVNTLWFQI